MSTFLEALLVLMAVVLSYQCNNVIESSQITHFIPILGVKILETAFRYSGNFMQLFQYSSNY